MASKQQVEEFYLINFYYIHFFRVCCCCFTLPDNASCWKSLSWTHVPWNTHIEDCYFLLKFIIYNYMRFSSRLFIHMCNNYNNFTFILELNHQRIARAHIRTNKQEFMAFMKVNNNHRVGSYINRQKKFNFLNSGQFRDLLSIGCYFDFFFLLRKQFELKCAITALQLCWIQQLYWR